MLVDASQPIKPDALEFFQENRRMVLHVAKSYRNSPAYEDILASCDAELWKIAAYSDKREPGYVYTVLRHATHDAYRQYIGMKRSEVRWKHEAKKIEEAFKEQHGFVPTTEYVMSFLPQQDSYRKHLMLCGMRSRLSIETKISHEEGSATIGDTLVDNGPMPYEHLDPNLLEGELKKALSRLPLPYQKLVTRHFIEGVEVRTIAREENCSQTNIRIKLNLSMRRLRKYFKNTPLVQEKIA